MISDDPISKAAGEPSRAPPVDADSPRARLLRLWKAGSAPDLDAFLADSEGLAPIPLAAVLRVDQRERWRLGQRVPAEAYLQRYPTVRDDNDAAADIVYAEFLLREKEGAAPAVEEFLWRFPHLASVLQPQIELHRALQAVPTHESGVAAAEPTLQAETLVLEQSLRIDSQGPVVPGYEILGELGRGGMGVVYQARHLRLKRLVALKMLLSGEHAGVGELARFRREAEAVARLRHPHIVQVYELGESEGRPYLALELIEGGSLKARLNGVPQPGLWSAELLETLARAVHYAHTQGVVHRDLKPANILLSVGQAFQPDASVRLESLTYVPRITDFGLAKQFGPQASHGEATRTGDVLGTPSYMSPEQAAGRVAEIGPATDVYALGSILYEMLTGRPPFLADSPLHTLQQVATEEPVSPSQLQRRLPRDLVTVCLKCLHKEPAKRYASAADLADDLRRFLAGEPIRARPVGVVERAWRWGRRYPAVASLAAALILGTAGGLAVMTGLYLHAREQAARATEAKEAALTAAADETKAKETAQAREAETTAVLKFVEDHIFAAARPKGQRGGLGHEVKLREAIEKALAYVDRSFADEPLIEARLRMTLGLSFLYLGEGKSAADQYQKARILYNQHLGPHHPDTLQSMHDLAISYRDLGRYQDAFQLCQETLALRKAKLGPDHPDTFRSMHNLAVSYSDLGRYQDAFQLCQETLALQRGKLGPEHPDTLASMLSVANSFSDLGRHPEALKLREEVLALLKAKLGPDHPDTLLGMNNLANSFSRFRRYQDALQLRQETLAWRQAQLGPEHPDTLQSMSNLANSFSALGWHTEALRWREEVLARRQAQLDPEHPDTLHSMHNLAGSYSDLDRPREARQVLEKVVALRKTVLGPNHSDTLWSMHNLANCLVDLDRPRDACKLREETLEGRKARLGPDHPDTLLSMSNLAQSYAALNRHRDACKLLEEIVTRRQAQLGPDHPDTLRSMHNLANSFSDFGQHPEALKWQEEVLARRQARLGPNHPDTLQSMHNLAFSCAALRRHQEARQVLEKVVALRKAVLGPDHSDTLWSMHNLANSLDDLDRHQDALQLHEETLTLRKAKLGSDHPDTLRSMWGVADSLVGLDRSAEAVRVIDECVRRAAGQRVHPPLIPAVMDLRLRHFEKARDAAGCRATAEMWEKLNRTDAGSLYDAACWRAVTAAVLRAGDKSEQAAKQADAEADQAMTWLKQAVAAGYKNVAHMKKDKDLDALCERSEFQQLLADLEKK